MGKPFKVAAYSFIVALAIYLLLGIFGISGGFLPITDLITDFDGVGCLFLFAHVILFVLTLFIFYGFISLARKFDNKLLLIVSYVGIVISFLYLIWLLFSSFFFDISDVSNWIWNSMPFSIVFHLIYSAIVGTCSIIHGIALIQIGKRAEYAKSAGIINIIAGATLFLFVGFLIMIAANILEILLFFNASKKFENKENNFGRRK